MRIGASSTIVPSCRRACAIVLPRIVAEDWLVSYRWLEGVERTFVRLGRRVADLAGGTEQVRARYGLLEADFHEFYPDLAEFASGLPRHWPASTGGESLSRPASKISEACNPDTGAPARRTRAPRQVPSVADCTILRRKGPLTYGPALRAKLDSSVELIGGPQGG